MRTNRVAKRIMKRVLPIIAASLLIAGTLLAEKTNSKKTFLMPRAAGVNKAMEHSSWHSHVYMQHKGTKTRIKSHVQVTPFFQYSVSKDDVGRYFGVGNGSNTFKIGTAAEVTAGKADLDGSLLIHNDATARLATGTKLKATTVTFKPNQETWGLRLDWFQDINAPIKDLFFKASIPIVYMQNDMNMKVNLPTTGDKGLATFGNKEFSIADFFAGRVEVTREDEGVTFDQTRDIQNPLTHAKIDGKRTAAGVADIDLSLGYKYLHGKKKYAFFNVGITIPTGNKPTGEYLFEPLYGNGNHVALGGGIDAGVELWKGNKGSIRVDGSLAYKYLFEGTEKRMPSVKNRAFGHYFMGGKLGQRHKPLFPMANVLTQSVRVKPGSQLDSVIDFSFHSKNFIVDFGYNLYWKDAESVWSKASTDTDYKIMIDRYSTRTLIQTPATILESINTQSTDFQAVKTPTQFTHKVFGALAYKTKISNSYPTSLGLGASYEFVHDNSALEQFALWAKAGVSF